MHKRAISLLQPTLSPCTLPCPAANAAAFVRQLKGRRFQAGVKYWIVCTTVLVSVLAILYAVPSAARHAPNFAYSAAAVGMSDRVESTVHKVRLFQLPAGWHACAVAWAVACCAVRVVCVDCRLGRSVRRATQQLALLPPAVTYHLF